MTIAAWIKPAPQLGDNNMHPGGGDIIGDGNRRYILKLLGTGDRGETAPYRLAARLNVKDGVATEPVLRADHWYQLVSCRPHHRGGKRSTPHAAPRRWPASRRGHHEELDGVKQVPSSDRHDRCNSDALFPPQHWKNKRHEVIWQMGAGSSSHLPMKVLEMTRQPTILALWMSVLIASTSFAAEPTEYDTSVRPIVRKVV